LHIEKYANEAETSQKRVQAGLVFCLNCFSFYLECATSY